MQNKNNWFSDAIYLDHVTELTKSNQRGEGLNKDWDPGPIAQGVMNGVGALGDAFTGDAGKHLLPAAVVGGGIVAGNLAGAAKRGITKLIDHGTKELGEDEKGATPPGYAPVNEKFRVEGRKKVVGGASPKKIVPVDTKAASMSGNEASPIKKSFFSSAVYPEEVGRQDNYSLRKSGPPREPEYVETPKRQPLAKPNFFESTILPHEAGRADHYLRKGIVPLDRFGFRKAKDQFAAPANWEGGPPEDPEADALDAHRMANPENTREVPFVPKPRDVRESDTARDSAIQDGTYGPNGDTSRSKPAFVPQRRSAPADGGGDRSAEAAKHFDSLLDHAMVQNNPDSSPRERNASAAKIGDAVLKMKKLLPQMTKQHIASLITALKAGDMGALEDIRNDLGMGHPDDGNHPNDAKGEGSTYSENGFDPQGGRI